MSARQILTALGEVKVSWIDQQSRFSAHCAYVEVGGDGSLSSDYGVGTTADAAVENYFIKLMNVTEPYYIVSRLEERVVNGFSGKRVRIHSRWNGSAFVPFEVLL